MSHRVPLAGLRSAAFALALMLSACGGGDNAPPANPAPNQAPIARAGADRTVNEAAPVQLDGSTSNDPNGAITQYQWTQIAGPAVTLANANTAVASFTAPATATTPKRPSGTKRAMTCGKKAGRRCAARSVEWCPERTNFLQVAASKAAHQ